MTSSSLAQLPLVFVLVAALSSLGAGCEGERLPSVPEQDDPDGSIRDAAGPFDASRDTNAEPDAEPPWIEGDASTDEDGGAIEPSDPSPECRPLEDGWIELKRHADAMYLGEPNLWMGERLSAALTSRVPADGLYVLELEREDLRAAGVYPIDGVCTGEPVAPLGYPSTDMMRVYRLDEGDITLVVGGEIRRGDQGTPRVQIHMRRICQEEPATECLTWSYELGQSACGVLREEPIQGDTECRELHAPGEVDARCPDTTFQNERVEGCCMPSGRCGHVEPDPQLGCTRRAQVSWYQLEFYCDERATAGAPDYFDCVGEYQSCESDSDCCADGQGNWSARCIDNMCTGAIY